MKRSWDSDGTPRRTLNRQVNSLSNVEVPGSNLSTSCFVFLCMFRYLLQFTYFFTWQSMLAAEGPSKAPINDLAQNDVKQASTSSVSICLNI